MPSLFRFFERKNLQEQETLEATENFPQLMMEPWRVVEMVEEESFRQRIRLFTLLNHTRIAVAVFVLVSLLLSFDGEKAPPLITAIIYITGILSLNHWAQQQQQRIIDMAWLLGFVEVGFILLLLLNFETSQVLGLLIFSIILSSMLLPVGRALILTVFAIAVGGYSLGHFATSSLIFYDFWDKQRGVFNQLFYSKEVHSMLFAAMTLSVLPIMVSLLTSWSFRNEVRAQFRYKQLRQVLSFNTSVIEHLKSGVLVLNEAGNILSINQRALEMLAINSNQPIIRLSDVSEYLLNTFLRWQSHGMEDKTPYRHNSDAEEVSLSFTSFGKKGSSLVMMTLESVNESMVQAREARLSSLGKLTAGVAHEIRNPLSAINSAAELLIETAKDDKIIKLSQMVLNNTKRTNQIISDILGLFKESKQKPTFLDIASFCQVFCHRFVIANKNDRFEIYVENELPSKASIFFDESQLDLVLWNICQNALKYAQTKNNPLIIQILLQTGEQSRNVYVNIIDNGPGVSKDHLEYIFEPFFAGHSQGTGLGLYLVKEICNSNNANIFAIDDTAKSKNHDAKSSGAHFRLKVRAYDALPESDSKTENPRKLTT